MAVSFLIDNAFDFPAVVAEDVHFVFLVRMPFRFRVGSPYHRSIEHNGKRYDIWVKNRPAKVEPDENGMATSSLFLQGFKFDDLYSVVAIIPHNTKLTPPELHVLQNCNGQVDTVNLTSRSKYEADAREALNAFTLGYHNATGEVFGGKVLRVLDFLEFMHIVVGEVNVVGVPIAYWNPDTIDELFRMETGSRYIQGDQFTGDLHDLPEDVLKGIGQATLWANRFYFYELAFEAHAKMIGMDYKGALLMAVAALEGVHGAFVTHALQTRLPPNRTSDDKSIEDNFLKELGFALCNKVTPYLFMDEGERPPRDLIKRVETAIKYRNNIMHVLGDSKGQYKNRLVTNADLSSAYSDALKLYGYYRKALEKRLLPDMTESTDSNTNVPGGEGTSTDV